MSHDDGDSPFDDDYEQMMADDDGEQLRPEDVFSMVLINKKRNVKVDVELRDAEGNVIELYEVIEDLLKYIEKKLGTQEGNQFSDQIYPLMSKMLVSGLGRLVGIHRTGFYLAQDDTRYSFINMMSLSFLLLKYIQQKGLTIHTREESVTEEEIMEVERKVKENAELVMSAMQSHTSKSTIKSLLNSGKLSREDLKELLDEQDKQGN